MQQPNFTYVLCNSVTMPIVSLFVKRVVCSQSIIEFKQKAAKKLASYIYFKVLISVLWF